MADRDETKNSPERSARTKSSRNRTKRKQPELSDKEAANNYTDDTLTPTKDRENSQKGKKTPQKRRQPKPSAGTGGEDTDGIDNPGFNRNESNNEKAPTPRRKKKVPRSHSPTAGGYSSAHSLQSGRSLPLSGDQSENNADKTSKPRKKRRRKPAADLSSTKIESLGLDLADIEDDIIENGTDDDTESVNLAPQKHLMKSQPIGKLYIEQTHGFKSVNAAYTVPAKSNKPSLVDRLIKHLHLTGDFDNINDSTIKKNVPEQLTLLQHLRSKFGLPTPSTASLHLGDNASPPKREVKIKLVPKGQHPQALGGFKSAEQKVIDELYSEERRKQGENLDEEQAYPVQLSAMAFALTSIKVFKTITHFCMGILAGLAIWQTIYAFTFTNSVNDNSVFLEIYRSISVPINCVFYIILVFCTVAMFDRYDVSKITRPCLLKACTLQSGAVAAILYTAALCVNVSLAPMDDRLGPKSNGTYDALRTLSDPEDRTRFLRIWRVLSLLRAVLVSLAWFIVSLRPGTDRLTKNLSQTEVTWGDKDENNINMTVTKENGFTRA